MATTSKSRRKRTAPAVHITLAKFNTQHPYEVAREGVPIADFRPLTARDYLPGASTPLRDSTARMISHGDELRGDGHVTILLLVDESASMGGNREAVVSSVNQFVDGMGDVDSVDPKTAGTVLAVVVTDGQENSSREVDHATLQQMIHDREKDGWTFIFLGADIDAWGQGMSLGLSGGARGQTVSYRSTPKGTAAVMDSVTTDAQGYLGNSQLYASSRSGSSMRSVTEDGVEVSSNINAPSSGVTPVGGPPSPLAGTGGPGGAPLSVPRSPYNVEEALKKAKEKTS